MSLIRAIGLYAALCCTPAVAGIPTDVPVTCPVGGETFTVTSTLSCSTGGRTMSFAPTSSCDFVTRLPVCPSNGLPLYREFTATEVDSLTELVASPDWDAMGQLAPWERSYRIEERLAGIGSETSFAIVLRGLWFAPDTVLKSPEMMAALRLEATREAERAPGETRGIVLGILAFALAHSGDAPAAIDMLRMARDTPDLSADRLRYIDAVADCLGAIESEACQPMSRLRY